MTRFGVSPSGARLRGPRASCWAPLTRLAAPLAVLLALDPGLAGATLPRALVGADTERVAAVLAAAGNRVDGLTVEEIDDGTTTLRLVGTAKPTFNVYRLQDPERLVVDIAASERGKVVPHLPLDTWACGRLTVDDVTEQDAKLVRLVIELKRESSYIVVPDDNELVVTITPRQVPPETYFARKSASVRRDEIEAAKRDATRMRDDAAALQAEARTTNERAHATGAALELATRRATAAREAEARAREAELRAEASERRARATLAASKDHRGHARRAVRAAAREHERARAARERAESARVNAERVLVVARRDAKAVTKAEPVAAASKQAAQAAEQAAAAKRAEAERAEARARSRLAAAEAVARKAEAEAAALRATASEADRSATRKLAEAETKLAAAETKLGDAQREAARTKAAADELLARAEVKAKTTVAAAKIEADRTVAAKIREESAGSETLAVRERAEALLAAATEAATIAGKQRRAAIAARKHADRELAEAKAAAAKAERRGEHDPVASARVAAAEAARAAARAKQTRAEDDVRALTAARDELTAKLAVERKSAALRREREARAREHASAQAELDAAQKTLADLGEPVTAAELARARAELAGVQATTKAEGERVARLGKVSASAKQRADAANRKLRDLEAGGGRRRKVKAARAEAVRAHASANTAEADLVRAARRLTAMKATVAARSAEIERLLERRTRLAREGDSFARKQAAARAEVARAEGKLADATRGLATPRDRLRAIEDDVRAAQAKLDGRLGEIAARSAPPKPEKPAPAPAAKAETRYAEQSNATPVRAGKPARVKDVRFEDDRDESRVVVVFEGALSFSGSSLTPTIQVLELEHVKMPSALERSLDATAYHGPVKLVTSFAEEGDAKVVVSTTQATKARLEEKPGQLVWHFPRTAGKGGKTSDAVSMAGTRVASAKTTAAPPSVAAAMSLPRNAPLAAVAAPASARDSDLDLDNPPARGRRTKWRGERIDIELQDAPMKDVLLLFSDIGKVNIISGRNVEGSVTMKLSRVPWDQALDIILRSQGLGYTVDGNVYRVATLEDLEAERRAAIERANARVQLKPLETRLVPVSYATVDEMVPKVQSVLSPRGSVTPDTRTNTLIIMDVAENIALAEQLVGQLDTQTPQVLIEARIVEARTSFTRQLGVQWGFDFIASPGTGNPTGLLFPNSVGVGGGATGTPADNRGLILPAAAANPNYAVDLPIPVGTGTGGAIGFSFGSLGGNLNTNLRLSASESTGEIRIISAPKIVTLDNSEALIEQGVQIPISQVSAQGVNTRFVRATLSLTVTPHVTNEGAVLLDVTVEKNEADFVNTGARGDPTILTKSARSRMLINDSDTAVIGGIYTRTKAVNFDKIPWIADVPIIGWFFKQKSEADTRSEVLIFLTPKIVNRASSIGG